MNEKRNAMIDYIKAICIMFVIIDHMGSINNSQNPCYLFLVRMAVPVFMLISGYNFYASYSKLSLSEMYQWNHIKAKFWRFTIPTLIAFAVYWILQAVTGKVLGIDSVVACFLLGQYGPGAYYYGFMIQFMLIYPVICWIVRSWDIYGVIIIGVINLIYELGYRVCDIDLSRFVVHSTGDMTLYRALVFRYLLVLGMGALLRKYHIEDKKIEPQYLIQMLGIGILYLLLPGYFEMDYKVFVNWSNVSMMVGFYIFPICYIIINVVRGGLPLQAGLEKV